jgi:hypothetical protein
VSAQRLEALGSIVAVAPLPRPPLRGEPCQTPLTTQRFVRELGASGRRLLKFLPHALDHFLDCLRN